MKNILIVFSIISFFTSCRQEANFEPHAINFDRDVCFVCKMGLTDQRFAVQAINEYGEVRWYDDLGCLAENLRDEEQWNKWKGSLVKYWIGDAGMANEPSNWINAETAFYDYGIHTPMGYGYAAHALKPKSNQVFTFEETIKRIDEGKTMRENFIQKKMLMMKDHPEKMKKLKKKLEKERSKSEK